MSISKVVLNGVTQMDVTDTTAEAEDVTAPEVFYSSNGTRTVGTGTGGAVLSVNGQTGDVVLDAEDVGALPDTTTIPTKTSDLTNDSGYITGMTILSYGHSTWNDFITAYNARKVVYCRASTNADNPAASPQGRMAFMAYINNDPPTQVEFQFHRSIATHTDAQQGDQFFVYTLNSSTGWSFTVREMATRIVVGTGLKSTYSNGVLTISLA